MPLLILCAVLLLAGALAAQDTAPITRTIGQGRTLTLAYDIDQGGAEVIVTVNLTAQTDAGARARLIDTDAKAVLSMGAQTENQIGAMGAFSVGITMPARTGAHPLLVVLSGVLPGEATVSGSISSSAGSLSLAQTELALATVSGLHAPLKRFAVFGDNFSPMADYSSTVLVDFDVTPQAITFALQGVGTGLTEIRLYDVTGGDVLLGTLSALASGNMDTASMFTTPSYSGEVELRVEVEGDGSPGSVNWMMWLPSSVRVSGLAGDGLAKSGGGGGNSGGGCASGTTGPTLFALAALLLVTRFRRRGIRPASGCCAGGRPGSVTLPR